MHPTPRDTNTNGVCLTQPPVTHSTHQDMKFLEVHSDMETKRNKPKAKTAIGGPWGLRYKHEGELGGHTCRRDGGDDPKCITILVVTELKQKKIARPHFPRSCACFLDHHHECRCLQCTIDWSGMAGSWSYCDIQVHECTQLSSCAVHPSA